MGLKINREDNGAISIQDGTASPAYYTGLTNVTVKANRQTADGISIIHKRIGVITRDLSDIEEINGAPAGSDREAALEKLANEVFTAIL